MGVDDRKEGGVGSLSSYIAAIDDPTGKIAGRQETNGGRGRLPTRTAKFGGDCNHSEAYDAAPGKPPWHSRIGAASRAPETYILGGRQYSLTMAGDTPFAFTIY